MLCSRRLAVAANPRRRFCRSRMPSAAALAALALLLEPGGLGAQEAPAHAPSARSTATDPALRLEGFERHRRMAEASELKGLTWRFLGPENVSGRCTDVAVAGPPGQGRTIYAATASGGLWKTENDGTTWRAVFDDAPATTIGDVAVAASNPEIVWLGTGEANIYRSSQAGIGVYKSTDGGRTWAHKGLSDTATIARILIHPSRPEIVYVAASGHEWTANAQRGVFRSADGGDTWDKVLYLNDTTGAIDLAMDPADPDTLYAATWQRTRMKWNDPRTLPSDTGSGIHKSVDGGRTWKAIDAGLPPAGRRGRIGLDVCRTRPNVLYALVDDYEIAREPTAEERADPYGLPSSGFIRGATVYRSNNRGESWSRVSGHTPEQRTIMERQSGTYGWVFGQIRVDPNDPDTVYGLGVPLNVSSDGGRTFASLTTPGVDHHGMWIDPGDSSHLVIAYDQGLAISYDRGKTWRASDRGLPVAQFFNVALDMAKPFHAYGSSQDHGSYRATVDVSDGRGGAAAVAFDDAPGDEGSTHAIDPEDSEIVYSSGFYGTLTRTDVRKPKDEREKRLLPARFPDEPPLRGQWLAPTMISPHNPHTLYHGMQYLLRSRDRGDTWDVVSPDLTDGLAASKGDIPYHTIFAISESPRRFGLLYVGTDDGRVHVSRDGGNTWREITRGLAPGRWISRVVASARDLGVVYLTQNGKRDDDFTPYVWKSTDFGNTWTSLARDVPLGPVNVIREDPSNADILYLGTDLGVYASTDAGRTWQVLGRNLPTTYVHDLAVHPRDNVLVAATHGRGMWVVDLTPLNKKGQRPPTD